MLGQRPALAEIAQQEFDIIVVGGGITGAAVLQEASRQKYRVLLLEQQDFAWGTSSRSSKMVHGGLRYIAQGDIRLTRHSLQERERLLEALPNLVKRKHYLFPVRKGVFPGRWSFGVLLWLYDFLAGIRDHRWVSGQELKQRVPGLLDLQLKGAMSYTDALTDDARLVMRVLHDGCERGGMARNYTQVMSVTPQRRQGQPDQYHVEVKDRLSGETARVTAGRVINATGAWADRLSASAARVRPLRGSHIFLPLSRLPLDDCLTILHPEDNRPVFFFPWEGVLCVGTTDLDHKDNMDEEARCSEEELRYLLKVINHQFPDIGMTQDDVISTMAGVRPVISSGEGLDPSKERRDHSVWEANGVITVSGGKLTTFRRIALDCLHLGGFLTDQQHKQLSHHPGKPFLDLSQPVPAALEEPIDGQVIQASREQQLEWVRWVLENEMVVHLDDLLLRRTRLGNLLGEQVDALMSALKPLCCEYLGWSEPQWHTEQARYWQIFNDYYSLPSMRADVAEIT